MKKAEDIAVEAGLFKSVEAIEQNFGLQASRDCWRETSRNIIKAIKAAQIDAIEATVLKCSQEAKIDKIIVSSPFKSIANQSDNYGFVINKQSLIDIGEQLKKELE